MIRAILIIAIMFIECFYMIGLHTDVVHRDNFIQIEYLRQFYTKPYVTVVESANMHPSENLKILASNDARMKGYKRVQTIRKDMTYLLVYKRDAS